MNTTMLARYGAATAMALLWLCSLWLVDTRGEFALNDDWQYAYAVKHGLEQGELAYRGVFSPIVLAQVAWGWLCCQLAAAGAFSFTVLRWSTLVLIPIGWWCLSRLFTKIGGVKEDVPVLGLAYLGTPLVFVLGVSFMSDVPFMVMMLLGVKAYWDYLERQTLPFLWLALLFGVLAFYIRQPGICLPLAIGVHQFWIRGRQGIVFFIMMLAISITVYTSWTFVVKEWLGLAAHFKHDEVGFVRLAISSPVQFTSTFALRLLKSFIYLGFFSLPLLYYTIRQHLSWKIYAWSGVIAALLLAGAYWAGKPFPFGGNIFYNLGLGPELLVDTYTLGLSNTPRWPLWAMYGLHAAAVMHLVLLVAAVWRSWQNWSPALRQYGVFWLGLSLPYFGLMAITSYYDRYVLLPLVLLWPIIMALPKPQVARGMHLRWVLPLMVWLFSVAATHDYLAWNRASQQAHAWLTRFHHIPTEFIDAGYAINGWHNYGKERMLSDEVSFWWVQDPRFMLTFGHVEGYAILREFPYQRWLWCREDSIKVLERTGDGAGQ